MCKIILVFIENIKQQKRILNSPTVFVLEIYIFFLHKFKGEEEMEWWKSQLKEKHFPKAIFRVLENLVHASVITILNGIVPTQKI